MEVYKCRTGSYQVIYFNLQLPDDVAVVVAEEEEEEEATEAEVVAVVA